MAEEHERGFTVSDRRRFSSEADEPGEAPEASRDAERISHPESRRAARHLDVGAAPGTGEARSERSDEGLASLPEMTLSTFIMSMSTQVLVLLGEIPNPVDNAVRRDMVAAKQVIDILGMLKEKTRGNLESSEEILFENVLYDLRMRYVELAKSDVGR